MNYRHRVAPGVVLCALAAGALPGCTRESVRIAIETQRRADQVQQAVFDRQHESLLILLYRDLVSRLNTAGEKLSVEQRAIVNQVWNGRDLLEFWAVQQERARALRLVGVDAKLAGDQAVVDLLIKSVERKVDRVEQGLAAQAGEAAAEQVGAGRADE